jgi:predicted TPR repeat methyltransferase
LASQAREILGRTCRDKVSLILKSCLDFRRSVHADTFCYFGELESVIKAAANALRQSAHLIFTAEESAAKDAMLDFRLTPSGRYSHTEEYLEHVLQKRGLTVCSISRVTLRMEYQKPVAGLLAVARKDKPQPK